MRILTVRRGSVVQGHGSALMITGDGVPRGRSIVATMRRPARVAQWIERWPPEPKVAGSNPAARARGILAPQGGSHDRIVQSATSSGRWGHIGDTRRAPVPRRARPPAAPPAWCASGRTRGRSLGHARRRASSPSPARCSGDETASETGTLSVRGRITPAPGMTRPLTRGRARGLSRSRASRAPHRRRSRARARPSGLRRRRDRCPSWERAIRRAGLSIRMHSRWPPEPTVAGSNPAAVSAPARVVRSRRTGSPSGYRPYKGTA